MIKIKVTGVDKTINFLKTFAEGYEDVSLNAISEYLMGDERHGLKHYPPYKHVSFKQAYGGFLSDKQRRYVMMKIRSGEIDPGYSASNGYYGDAWQTNKIADGKYVISNDVHYAGYLVGDDRQSKMMQMKGWRVVSQNIKDNIMGAFRHARGAINKFIKESKQ